MFKSFFLTRQEEEEEKKSFLIKLKKKKKVRNQNQRRIAQGKWKKKTKTYFFLLTFSFVERLYSDLLVFFFPLVKIFIQKKFKFCVLRESNWGEGKSDPPSFIKTTG